MDGYGSQLNHQHVKSPLGNPKTQPSLEGGSAEGPRLEEAVDQTRESVFSV